MSRDRTYTPTGMLLHESEARWYADVCLSVRSEDATRVIRDREAKECALFLNHLLVNGLYKGTSPISAASGRQLYPKVFGRSSSKYRANAGEGTQKRILDRLIERGIIARTPYDKRRGKSREFFITEKCIQASMHLCAIESQTRVITLENYVTAALAQEAHDRQIISSKDFQSVDELLKALMHVQSKRSIQKMQAKLIEPRKELKRRDVGRDGVPVSVKLKTIEKSLKAGAKLDLTLLRETFNEDWLSLAYKVTKPLSDRKKRAFLRGLSKSLNEGTKINQALKVISSRYEIDLTTIKAFEERRKQLMTIGNILNSGRHSYFTEVENRVLPETGEIVSEVREYLTYWDKYFMIESGRLYVEGGGLQSAKRTMKDLLIGTTGINYDLPSCHLNVIQNLAKKHEVGSICSILDNFDNTQHVFDLFYVNEHATVATLHRDNLVPTFVDKETRPHGNTKIIEFENGSELYIKKERVFQGEYTLASTEIHMMSSYVQKGIIKKLLYNTLNNAGSNVRSSPQAATCKYISDQFRLDRKINKKNADLLARTVVMCWNSFCSRIRIFDLLKSLVGRIANQGSYQKGILYIRNEFGLNLELEVTKNQNDKCIYNLTRSQQRKVLSHIFFGFEVQYLYEVIRDNKNVNVFLLDHDGLCVDKNTDLEVKHSYIVKYHTNAPYEQTRARRRQMATIL